MNHPPLSSGSATACLRAHGPDLFPRLVSAYEQDSGELMSMIKASLADEDMAALIEPARVLRKAAEILFAESVCVLTRKLEASTSSGQIERVRHLIERIESENRVFLASGR